VRKVHFVDQPGAITKSIFLRIRCKMASINNDD